MSGPSAVKVHPPGVHETLTVRPPTNGTGITVSVNQQGSRSAPPAAQPTTASAPATGGAQFPLSAHNKRSRHHGRQPSLSSSAPGLLRSSDAPMPPFPRRSFGSGGGRHMRRPSSSSAGAMRGERKRRSPSSSSGGRAVEIDKSRDYSLLVNPDKAKPNVVIKDVVEKLADRNSGDESGSDSDDSRSGSESESGSGGASDSGSDSGRERRGPPRHSNRESSRSHRRGGSGSDSDVSGASGDESDFGHGGRGHGGGGDGDDPKWMVRPTLESPRSPSRLHGVPGSAGVGVGVGALSRGGAGASASSSSSSNPMKNYKQEQINRRARLLVRLDRHKIKYDADAPTADLELLDAKVRQEKRCESVVSGLKMAIMGIAVFEEKLAEHYPGFVDLENHSKRVAVKLDTYNEILYDIYDHYVADTEVSPIWTLAMVHLSELAQTHLENITMKDLMHRSGAQDPAQFAARMRDMAAQMHQAQQQQQNQQPLHHPGMGGAQGPPMPPSGGAGGGVGIGPHGLQMPPIPDGRTMAAFGMQPMHAREPMAAMASPRPQGQGQGGPVSPQQLRTARLPGPSFKPYATPTSMSEVVQMLHKAEDEAASTAQNAQKQNKEKEEKSQVKEVLAGLSRRGGGANAKQPTTTTTVTSSSSSSKDPNVRIVG